MMDSIILKWVSLLLFMLGCTRWTKRSIWIIISFGSICFRSDSKKSTDNKLYERNERDIWQSLFYWTNGWTNVAATSPPVHITATVITHSLFFSFRARSSDFWICCFLRCFPAHMQRALSIFPYSNVKTCLLKFPVFKSTCLPFDWIVNKFLHNSLSLSLAVFVISVISIYIHLLVSSEIRLAFLCSLV